MITKKILMREKLITTINISGKPINIHANPTPVDVENIFQYGAQAINIGVTVEGILFIWNSQYMWKDIENEINKKTTRPIEFVWMFTYNKNEPRIKLGSTMQEGWDSKLKGSSLIRAIKVFKEAFPSADSLNSTIKLK